MDMDVDHIDIRVYGPRNFLLGQARVPAHHVKEFSSLLEKARRLNPIYDPGLLVRWMVKAGHTAVARALSQGKAEQNPGS